MASPHHPQRHQPAGVRQMRYEEPQDPEPPEAFIMGMNIISVITHLLLGAIAFYAILYANSIPNLLASYSVHIYLCVIGYVLIMSLAAISFNPYNGWMDTSKSRKRSVLYWVMQIGGATLAVAGSISGLLGAFTHFKSAHGITAVMAMVLTILSLIAGWLNSKHSNSSPPLKTLHAVLVSLTMALAFISLCLGFSYGRLGLGDGNVNMAIAFSVFALLGTLILTFGDIIRRRLS